MRLFDLRLRLAPRVRPSIWSRVLRDIRQRIGRLRSVAQSRVRWISVSTLRDLRTIHDTKALPLSDTQIEARAGRQWRIRRCSSVVRGLLLEVVDRWSG